MFLTSWLKRLISLLMVILWPCRRILCFLGRHRKPSGSILPTVNPDRYVSVETMQSVPTNDQSDLEMEPWDNWDVRSNPTAAVATQNLDNSNMQAGANHYLPNKFSRGVSHSSESEPEVDYFQDMQPAIKRTKKVLVRKSVDNSVSSHMSSRLQMTSDVPLPPQSSELGNWEESENAWGDEATEDLTWQAEETLREQRRTEREHRLQEQRRKRVEKDNLKTAKRDVGGLYAVKLS